MVLRGKYPGLDRTVASQVDKGGGVQGVGDIDWFFDRSADFGFGKWTEHLHFHLISLLLDTSNSIIQIIQKSVP